MVSITERSVSLDAVYAIDMYIFSRYYKTTYSLDFLLTASVQHTHNFVSAILKKYCVVVDVKILLIIFAL